MHSSQQNTITQEYSIRVPKNTIKRYNVMIFSATLGVDFSKWSTVKMERQNNMKEYKGVEEETPKFGAGSEFGKEAREEARRKKLGIVSRKYKPEDQPWILKVGGSAAKKFKGIREGGVSENASYYVFTHSLDGAIDAYPLNEWYRFQPIQRYKALSAEEAEQEFGKRNKVLNYFSLMLRKRLKGDEFTEAEDAEEKNKKDSTKKYKDLKISDMEEWMDTSDESSSEEEQKDDDKEEKKKNKKVQKKNKPKRDTDMEAFEDSDDGDNEGRELDYISDSSESEPEQNKELKGVAEEKALRKLLTSDEDSEEEENKSDKEQSNAEEEGKEGNKEEKDTDKKKSNKKKQKKKDASKKKKDKLDNDDSSDFSSDSTDSDTDSKKKTKKEDDKEKERDREKDKECNSASSSRSASPLQSAAQKRKLPTFTETITKKPKFENSLSNYIPGSIESGITEDAVRRYLMRKPMTTTELLQKFKSKKTGLSSEQLVNIMTQILKKINPVKQIIKGKMYLSIKA